MANTHETLTSLFSNIADSIRAVNGSEDTIVADDFPTAISNLSSSSIEMTLLAEVPIDDYNNGDSSYFTNLSNGYNGCYISSNILVGVRKDLPVNTSDYEALLIIFSHGARSGSSTDCMRIDFTNTPANLINSVSSASTACVVAEDYGYAYENTVYALIVNDAENLYAYAGGTYFPSTTSGSKRYSSDVIFNDTGIAYFLVSGGDGYDNYYDGYYAIYGINGLSSIANLLPQNS